MWVVAWVRPLLHHLRAVECFEPKKLLIKKARKGINAGDKFSIFKS